MESLLTALARDPERQRRRVLVGVGLAGLLLAGGALGQRALQTSGAALCRNPGARLAAAWEAPESNPSAPHPRRDATRAAFLATGARRAGDLWQRAATILDGYAKRWTAMYAEACEATHVRGEQSAEVLDLRMDCLNRNRDSLRALTDVFATADADTVGQRDRRGQRAARRRALRRRRGAARGASPAARSGGPRPGREPASTRRGGPRPRGRGPHEGRADKSAPAAGRGGDARLRAGRRGGAGAAGLSRRRDGRNEARCPKRASARCG